MVACLVGGLTDGQICGIRTQPPNYAVDLLPVLKWIKKFQRSARRVVQCVSVDCIPIFTALPWFLNVSILRLRTFKSGRRSSHESLRSTAREREKGSFVAERGPVSHGHAVRSILRT